MHCDPDRPNDVKSQTIWSAGPCPRFPLRRSRLLPLATLISVFPFHCNYSVSMKTAPPKGESGFATAESWDKAQDSKSAASPSFTATQLLNMKSGSACGSASLVVRRLQADRIGDSIKTLSQRNESPKLSVTSGLVSPSRLDSFADSAADGRLGKGSASPLKRLHIHEFGRSIGPAGGSIRTHQSESQTPLLTHLTTCFTPAKHCPIQNVFATGKDWAGRRAFPNRLVTA